MLLTLYSADCAFSGFTYCNDIEETKVDGLTITTEGFPNTVTTNPTCECTFSGDTEGYFVQILAQCNVST